MNDHELAVHLAQAAGALAAESFRTAVEVRYKSSPSDVVSDADEQAEALVRSSLARERPDDGMLGEEGTSTGGERRWLVDAIDGTLNFLKGDPFWCTAIALEDTDGIVASAVHHVATAETFSAVRGGGAWLNGVRLQRREVALSYAVLATYLHPGDADNATYRRVLDAVATSRMRGSGSLELAWVAAGRIDVWLQRNVLPWDWAPGSLLVSESGGCAASEVNAEGLWSFACGAGSQTSLLRLIADC